MPRNLDVTALRSFVAVADAGAVTRAAGFLNLTQSAVSMQLKRLEDAVGQVLLDRSARGVAPTAAGEQLLSYARRLVALNDEAVERLTSPAFEGEIRLGVPHDIFYPVIPPVLKAFAASHPRMRVTLNSSNTMALKGAFARGECDLILTTEDEVPPGARTLVRLPLLWVGAPGGSAWRRRPLPLAFERRCIFRAGVMAQLDRAAIPWEVVVESDRTRPVEVSVSADLAVHAMLAGTMMPETEVIEAKGSLPDLGSIAINLYAQPATKGGAAEELVQRLARGFAALAPAATGGRAA